MNKKQSFLAGSLTSTAGIFISKAMSLLYVVPFTKMATEANMFYYSQSYTYFELLLSICTAGFPFAVSAMVAKYANKEDYRTVMLIRKMSMSLMLLSGFIIAIIFMATSGILSAHVLGPNATQIELDRMKTTFMILAIAIMLVPFLSVFRGFYQGLKELKVYAQSQVLEQFVRIIALLLLSYIGIYFFNFDRIVAIYMAVLSTSLAAFFAIIYYYRFDRKTIGVYRRACRKQNTKAVNSKRLFNEMLMFGIPYLIAAILGNSMSIVNSTFFMTAMSSFTEVAHKEAMLMYSVLQFQCNKLTSIVQVLALGFGAGIVPYLTTSLENRNYKELQKNVLDCLDTVLYIGLPLTFCLLLLSEPIYFIMYGDANLALGTEALKISAPIAITGTLAPISTQMVMTLRMRRKNLFYLFVGFSVKLITFFPLIYKFGYSGAITSSIITGCVVIFLNLQAISNRYHVRYRRVFKRLIKIILGLLAMNGSFFALKIIGFNALDQTSVLFTILRLAVYGLLGLLVYYQVTSMLNLPQYIFKTTFKGFINRIRKGKK